MGVLGLWNLLEPVGKPVPIESLENKILAVDISIWLNQAVKGYRDRTGNAVPHAHLLGLYNRVCKLLFYRIKPVFIFDGQPPKLKRDTLIRRRMRKSKVNRKAQAASAKILDNYLKSQAIAQKLQRQSFAINKVNKGGTSALHSMLSKRSEAREKDLFELPDLPQESKKESSDDSDSEPEMILDKLGVDTSDIYNLDVGSNKFKTLPQELQYDVLSDMREKRKQNSWARIHQMPSKAENFSSFQLDRLKHRRNIQKAFNNVQDTLKDDLENSYTEDLFVGDLPGMKNIKKQMKKTASNPSTATVYLSGIQSARDREEEIARQKIEAEKLKERQDLDRMNEKRELVDDPDDPVDDPDDPLEVEQLNEAIARSLQDSGPSQQDILKMIKKETDSDEPEILLLPDASYITSNRSGGQIIKIEIKDEPLDPEEVSGTSGSFAGISGTSGSAAGTSGNNAKTSGLTSSIKKEPEDVQKGITKKEEETDEDEIEADDLFADVFKTREDHSALLNIFEKAANKTSAESVPEIMSDSSSSEDNIANAEVMSDSESEEEESKVDIMSDSDKEENEGEDMFADIFTSQQNVDKLDEIIQTNKHDKKPGSEPEVNTEAEALLAEVGKLDKPTDIFSQISKAARSRAETNEEGQARKENETEVSDEASTSTNTQEIAATMKNSSHLFMKIASKYAQEFAETKDGPSTSSSGNKRPSPGGAVSQQPPASVATASKRLKRSEDERGGGEEELVMMDHGRLAQEMREREKRSRLLQFTEMSYNNSSADKDSADPDDDFDDDLDDDLDGNNKGQDGDDTEKALSRLGVTSVSADKYKLDVLTQEGLIDKDDLKRKRKEKEAEVDSEAVKSTTGDEHEANKDKQSVDSPKKDKVVYSASAPGFSRGSRGDERVVEMTSSAGLPQSSSLTDAPDMEVDDPGDDAAILDEDELYRIQAQLAQENRSLVAEMNKADRVANSITDQMYAECQELLQLFGIPWIVSPTEAESQCAWLDINGLTQGTITDDSDIWLFGGRRVYKNFFNQEKFVEMFKYEEISHHFGLNREKLILLAMLTGSDYTEGVEGVGPVTALEVLAEFPGDGLEPLQQLKQWWQRVHLEYGKDYGMPVGNKTREKLRKLKLSSGFPSQAVMTAYLEPAVDSNREKFSWSVPNFVAVRDFAQERFGWSKMQIDDLIQPVVRSLQKVSHQGRIDSFFSSYRVNLPEKGLQSSKRVNEALRKVKGLAPSPKKSPAKKMSAVSGSPTNFPAKKTSADAVRQSPAKNTNQQTKRRRKPDRAVLRLPSTSSGNISSAVANPDAGNSSSAVASSQERNSVANQHQETDGVSSKSDVSLIARSCGVVINPSRDDLILQREERQRREKEARERAAKIWKEAQATQKQKKVRKRPSRVKLRDHNLSEDED